MEHLRLFEEDVLYHASKDTFTWPTVSYCEDSGIVYWMTKTVDRGPIIKATFSVTQEDVDNYNGEDIRPLEWVESRIKTLRVNGVDHPTLPSYTQTVHTNISLNDDGETIISDTSWCDFDAVNSI